METHCLDAARKLLVKAGYTSDKPLTLKVVVPSSGSGMMQPLPMNEYLQQNLGAVGVKVNLEVMEWNTLINAWRAGAKDASSRSGVALNYSYFVQDPFTAFTRVDRNGMPAVAVALIGGATPADRPLKDRYNDANPSDDVAGVFVPDIVNQLTLLHNALADDLIALGLRVCST